MSPGLATLRQSVLELISYHLEASAASSVKRGQCLARSFGMMCMLCSTQFHARTWCSRGGGGWWYSRNQIRVKTTTRKHPAPSLLCSPGTVVRAWELSVPTEAEAGLAHGHRPQSSSDWVRCVSPESPCALPQ